jgi:hypothetical protein
LKVDALLSIPRKDSIEYFVDSSAVNKILKKLFWIGGVLKESDG